MQRVITTPKLWVSKHSLLVGWMLLSAATAAEAQLPDTVYRATHYTTVEETQDFGTLAEAEAYIRIEPATPRGNAFLEKRNDVNVSGDATIHYYAVPRRAAAYVGDFYEGHPTGNVTDCSGYKCRSEQEAVAASMRAYPLQNAYTATLQGAYLTPPYTKWSYSYSDKGNLEMVMNGAELGGAPVPSRRLITATSTSGGSSYVYPVKRMDYYQCPELFYVMPSSTVGTQVDWPLVCANAATATIRKITKQKAPVCGIDVKNGNPCNAETGNKEYKETDFSWDGYEFSRNYNSVADFSLMSGFGDNWANSFSERLALNGATLKYLVRSDGYIEDFSEVGSGSGIYRPYASRNTVLRKESDPAVIAAKGAWELIRPDGSHSWFSATGRLLRRENGVRSLVFQYCQGDALALGQCPSTDALTKVVSASGRSLVLEYTVIPVASGNLSKLRLLRIKSDGDTLIEYGYDAEARLISARHGGASGEGRQYLYAEAGLLCRDWQGNQIASCNAGNFPNHLTGVIGEDGVRFTTYTYDERGRATSSEYAGGNGRVALEYVSATSVKVKQPSGAIKAYTFSAEVFNKPLQSTLTDAVDTSVQTTSAGYTSGRLSHRVSPSGSRTNYGYDGLHEISRVEGLSSTGAVTAHSRTIQTDWSATVHLPTERRVLDNTGALVAKSKQTYNDRGQMLTASQVDVATGAERINAYTYCETADVGGAGCPILGLLKRVDGARTDINDFTNYAYYDQDDAACSSAPSLCAYRKGDFWKATNALGQTTEVLRYDAAGRPLMVMDASGVVTEYEYHPRGWLIATKVRGADDDSEADDAIIRMEYTSTGMIKKVIQPDGMFIRYEYDAAHRLVDVYDSGGNRIHYTLDSAGNRTKEDTLGISGEIKRTASRVYNQLGQLKIAKTAYDHPTGFTYDASGNGDVTTDALGREADSDYDPLSRLVKTLEDVGGINAKTEFKYDALDRLTRVTDPKNLDTAYAYNGFGDQVQLTSPDTGVSTYTYDSAGNRKTETDARNITRTYSYDALNRPIAVAYPTTSLNVGYEYDVVPTACAAGETFATGRLSLITDASGSTQYCYDRFGRMVRKVQTTNGKVFILRYAYTLAGQLSSVTYPDGAVVSYQRDAQGRVSQIDAKRAVAGASSEALLSQAAYHPFGSVEGWTYGNGRRLARPVDLDYRTTAVADPSAGGLSVGFGFDVAGNLNQLTPAGSSTPLLKYDYDGLDRLTHLRDGPSSTPIETYSYDATGNRLSLTQASGTQTYVYPATSHRLTQVGSGNLRGYDASGNSTEIDANSFVYNDAGRMSQLKQSGVLKMTYLYNGLGEQVRKYTDTYNRYMVYDESGHWLGEYDSNGATIQQAIWMDDLPVGVLAGADVQQKLHYVEPDHLGTPRVVIDPVRNVAVWNWDLKGEAFGNSAPNQDPDLDGTAFVFDMRFPGQRFDSLSGSSYNYSRDYEADTGRYVQSDSIGLAGGISTYVYSLNDPLKLVDPSGKSVTCSGNYCRVECYFPACLIDYAYVVGLYIDRLIQNSKNSRDEGSLGGDNVIPFPRPKEKVAECALPDGGDDCLNIKATIMSARTSIEMARVMQGGDSGAVIAMMRQWNYAASEYNRQCVPRGYAPIDIMFFYDLGPRGLR